MTEFETFIINLPKSTNRWKVIQKLLNNSDLFSFQRVDGVLGEEALKDPNVVKNLAKGVLDVIESKRRNAHDQHSVGSLGCYLAHVNAWKKFQQESSKPYLFVLEDDAWIPNDIRKKLENVILQTQIKMINWDVLVVGNRVLWGSSKNFGKIDYGDGEIEMIKATFYTGMSGYLIKRESLPKILEQVFPIKYQLDWFFGHNSSKFNVFVSYPFLVNLTGECHKSEINHTPVGMWPIMRKARESESNNSSKVPYIVMAILIFALIVLSAAASVSHKKPCGCPNKH